MKPPIEHIKLSSQSKDQLIRLKRDTGIGNWNVLCRWAFLLSLADKTRPVRTDPKTDSNVEMSWKVFCGEQENILKALFYLRCQQDNIVTDTDRSVEFRKHLARGISTISNRTKRHSIATFVESVNN
ncbi:MAG: DNA sulfur modification protein DndE [Kiritimatiellae bacterium]|nr:DNA sulfur modification protein DndE [Kiritimatiellia bacterium]MDD5519517.1 DNA sulfur modification protein DndE [Kiritimatiellia bacterium]